MSIAFVWVCAVFIAGKWAVQVWLERLNQRHVQEHADEIPAAFQGVVDAATYAKSVAYTLAKSRFHVIVLTWDALVLGAVLFTPLLPWFHRIFDNAFGSSAWAGAGFLAATALVLSLPGLPWEWHDQFHLEERFGFNTTTPRLWWTDRFKGLLLGLVLGYPLLVLILKLVGWIGPAWWLWAWGCVVLFQWVMMLAAPVLILPLFNKLSPLPQGDLRDLLLALAARTGFAARDIQVMDGSKRSRHSNAFFTGLGRFRRIVLFDTLIEQLNPAELEAVLAHEIGHYKKRHILKMMAGSSAGLFAAFFVVSLLAGQAWFYRSFGFEPGSIVPALLLFGLLSGVFTFWFAPLAHRWSRKYEYEADAYAARAVARAEPLIGALRKLNEKNLSNLTPHPLYSGFYYSHPTLLEREAGIAKALK